MSEFLLEIGTEELPARFLPGLEAELTDKFAKGLTTAALPYASLSISSTPRRSVVYIEGISPASTESEELVTGPPVKIAFDASGKPTKAAEGFAKTQGVDFSEVFTVKNDKGEYIAARKKTGGVKAAEIFASLCPEVVNSLSFPKRMRWGSNDYLFARPLRWLLALLGEDIITFQCGEVTSGRTTRGHRVHGPGPFDVPAASAYFDLIKSKGGLTPAASERRNLITKRGDELAAAAGGRVIWKESLLDEVQGLCEHPVSILGNFDASFLEVPREVLITSMESHQKSFALEDASGKMLPYFLTVSNITPQDEDVVRKGWEKVLRARLEDARFFWKGDLANNFDAWLAKLDKVIFLAPLGSMGDKTRRISALAGFLASKVSGLAASDAERAGRLSKADLVTEMVGEFDTLQGIMGGIYAARMGENEVVATALAEQYLPAGPDSPLPQTLCGALLSIADKADTMAGCFGLGMIPTGAADPYALRRCALGIARIMVDKKFRFSIREVFAHAQSLYGERNWKLEQAEALERMVEFFAGRLKHYFTGLGYETLLVEGTLLAGSEDVWGAQARLEALQKFSQQADFNEAVLTFKRAANIIRKQGQAYTLDGSYKAELLQDDAEKSFAAALQDFTPTFDKLWVADDYSALFDLMYGLKPTVDEFFSKVMVMAEDESLRLNRLNLLEALVDKFKKLADFDALQM